jgi:Domain of unknown function (DUF4412)
MKSVALALIFTLCLLASSRADLTLVQKVEGARQGGSDMTIKVKGDKARIDVSPKFTTIIDSKTGEIVNLMNDRKTVMRISADKMRAAADMIGKFNANATNPEKGKLTPTGKKEKVAGYDVEEYVYAMPDFKATYWIAPNYPDSAAILKELQSLNSDLWQTNNLRLPDYRDFPGLPVKTIVSTGDSTVTTTVVSVSKAPLDESEFSVPKDFKEMKIPEMHFAPPGEKGREEKPGASVSPQP